MPDRQRALGPVQQATTRQRALGPQQAAGGRQRAIAGQGAPAQHHGWLHNVVHGAEHVAGQTLNDFETMAVNSPAGLWNVAKATGQAVTGNPKPLENVAVGMGKGFLQDFQHPLRHPGNTLLDIGGLLSLGMGTSARLAAAGRAADAGAAAKILVGGTAPEARNLEFGGMKVGAGSYSRNAMRRSTQKMVDQLHAKFPELRLPMRTLPERVGHEMAKTRRFSEAVGRVPAGALVLAGKKLSTPQMVALQVVMEGVPVADRLAFHENQLVGMTGRAARGTSKQIALLKTADRYIHDVNGAPALKPEFKDMQAVYDRIARVAGGREDIMGQLGKTPSEARVSQPGQLLTGGHYERPTPGKLGVTSPALREAHAYRDQLQRRLDAETTKRRTPAEAQRALTKLEREHNAALDKVAGGMFGDIKQGEVNFRTAENKRAARQNASTSGASGRMSTTRRTVSQEMRDLAEKKIEETIAADATTGATKTQVEEQIVKQQRKAEIATNHLKGESASMSPGSKSYVMARQELADAQKEIVRLKEAHTSAPSIAQPVHPIAARWKARTEAIDQLRTALNPELFAKIDKSQLGRSIVAPTEHTVRLRGALAIADERIARLEQSAASRVKDTGIVGSDFAGGNVRFPYQARAALPALGKVAGWKGGIPKTPGSFTHEFTGQLLGSGLFRNDTTRLVAESYIEAHRFEALLQARKDFIAAAHDTKTSEHDIPIRLDELANKPWPAAVHELVRTPEEAAHLSKDEVQALGMAYEGIRQHLFPPEAVAEQIPGVKWIDDRLLGGLNKPNPLVGVGSHVAGKRGLSVFDAINNASRAAILYLKPAYAVPNMLGNAALTMVEQGFAAPKNLLRSARLNARIGPDATAAIDAAMGEGFAAVMRADSGAGTKAINMMAGGWSKVVDLPFRRSAFFHEAAVSGFKTDAQIVKLLKDPAELDRVVRRANDAQIDYGNLGPIEREVIRRVIFFYPWVKGSSVYAAHFLGEHPQEAAVLAQTGQQGKAQSEADLGAVPSYANGVFKVGERLGMPLVSNPASASILGTPAQMLETIRELGSGNVKSAYSLSGNLTPAMQALNTIITGGTSMGQVKPGQSRLSGAAGELTSFPIRTLVDRLRSPPAATPSKLYPMDQRDSILNFLFGGIAPRPMNKATANKLAAAKK